MFVISLLVLLPCAGIAAIALWFVFRAVREEGKRRLVMGARGVLNGVPGGMGVSALCSDVWRCEQLENLLAVEYPRYEVLVVLDSQRRGEAFEAIRRRYFMIRVACNGCGELPVPGVRALYRSRRRCFRRLVLIDREVSTTADDFDAAAGVATCEYLLPVREGQMLVPGAVERLVVELSERPAGETEVIRTVGGAPTVLFGRRFVLREGGFGNHLIPRVPRNRRRTLYEALFSLPPCQRRKGLDFAVATMWFLLAGAAFLMGWWGVLAVLLTVVMVWVALVYAAPLVGGISRLGECALRKYVGE